MEKKLSLDFKPVLNANVLHSVETSEKNIYPPPNLALTFLAFPKGVVFSACIMSSWNYNQCFLLETTLATHVY